MSKEERNDMTMTPILSKYQYQKPKYFGDYMERCYPVSAVMDMLKEYSDQNTKPLIDEIAELKKEVSNCNRMIGHLEEISINKQAEIAKLKASKSEANEAVEFAEWIRQKTFFDSDNGYVKWQTFSKRNLTTTELYEIFKTRNNK